MPTESEMGKEMNCIVCKKDLGDGVWCPSCVTTTISRQIGYWDRVQREKRILANAMNKVIKKLSALDDDVLGLTSMDDPRHEWPLKKELQLRLMNALEEVGM